MESSSSLFKTTNKDNQINRGIFDYTNVAIWIIDAKELHSNLIEHFKNKQRNVSKLISRYPELSDTFIHKLKVADVNSYALKLYGAEDKQQMAGAAKKLFTGVGCTVMSQLFTALLDGSDEFNFNSSKYSFDGNKILTKVSIKIPEHCTDNWDEWIVTEVERNETSSERNNNFSELKKVKEQQQIQKKIISIISHDLQSPFNNIIGFSDIMLDRFDDYPKEKIMLFLRHINDTASQSYNLLNNLLNWAKLTRENYEVRKAHFNVGNNIDEVTSFFKTELDTKNIKIFNLTPPRFTINSDVDSFQFVIRNFLSNAIKFSNRNSRIVITANKEGDKSSISISDEGVGMDNVTKERILNSQELFSSIGTCREKGNGLGLKLCIEFMKRAGAVLDIESEVDKGTVFTITYPS